MPDMKCSRCLEEVDHIMELGNEDVCINCLTTDEEEERSEMWGGFLNPESYEDEQ